MPPDVICPKCQGPTWDNRLTKRNPKQPDFKCKDKSCDGVIWPPRNGQPARGGTSVSAEKSAYASGPHIPAIDGPTTPQTASTPGPTLDTLFNTYAVCYGHAAHLCKTEFGKDASDSAVAAMAAALLIAAQKAGLC